MIENMNSRPPSLGQQSPEVDNVARSDAFKYNHTQTSMKNECQSACYSISTAVHILLLSIVCADCTAPSLHEEKINSKQTSNTKIIPETAVFSCNLFQFCRTICQTLLLVTAIILIPRHPIYKVN